jgi:predicted nucleic acid-binding protein
MYQADRPKRYGLSIEEADARAAVIENSLDILPDGLAVHQELIVACRVSGVQVHDARLVAAMHVYGIKRILTFNDHDFARYTKVEAWHPESLSSRLGSI